jgi:hypothetical protein
VDKAVDAAAKEEGGVVVGSKREIERERYEWVRMRRAQTNVEVDRRKRARSEIELTQCVAILV